MSTLKRKRRRRDKAQRRTVRFLGVFGAIVGVFALAAVCLFATAATWLSDLPDYSKIDLYAKSGYTKILANDRTTVLGKLTLQNRTEVTIDKVSPYVLEGTVAVEDERFYQHQGVDLAGIARALFSNAQGRREGASTITQQLVRNTVLLDEMDDLTYARKVREMYIATKVENAYSKDAILMMYLNVVNYGDGCYGIEAASQHYFGKSAAELSLSQAAMLIGIPQSPSANNPNIDYGQALARRAHVLDRMLKNGAIDQGQYDKVIDKKPKVQNNPASYEFDKKLAPYFVDYVRETLKTSDEFSQSDLSQGGLTIYTTLDPKCQKAANKAVRDAMAEQGDGMDASLTSVDPDNGNIVAMVGGKDYDKDEFNLATQMSRQAGSSFKPFTLLAALTAGVSPDTYIDSSSPADITPTWTVSNSEGSGYGDMSLRSATTHSVNTVYAQLCHVIGAQKVVDMAHACGISSELMPYDSIALGAQGVNTLEMADAYATIANGGVHHAPVAVTEIEDGYGETIYTHQYDEGEQAISPAIAQVATEILETVVNEGTGTAAQLYTGQVAAGKTGTSENGRDLWFCGFTPQYATAVWSGYRAETPTGMYGGTVCAPIWHNYMTDVLEGAPLEEFPTTDEQPTYKDDWEFPSAGYTGGATKSHEESGGGDDEDEGDSAKKSSGKKRGSGSADKPAKPSGGSGNGDGGTGGATPEPDPAPASEPEPAETGGTGDDGGDAGGE